MKEKISNNIQIKNKRATFDYELLDTFTAGIVLTGTEIKSIRQGKCSVKEAYVSIDHGEAFVEGMNISPYEKGNIFNKDPLRRRKLLLHKAQIMKLDQSVAQKGYTIVPLSVYLKGGRCKVEIGLARGKHTYDKREDLKRKDARREAERDFKDVYRG